MIWKIIGQSVIGTSHIQSGKTCEDASSFKILTLPDGEEALILFVSDGAGSAAFAAKAAEESVIKAIDLATVLIQSESVFNDGILQGFGEQLYDHIERLAKEEQVPKNEFSCTLLGAILLPDKSVFIQIGDGAIVTSNQDGFFTPVWWPHNGEYQNTTAFLIDDPNLPTLKIKVLDSAVMEIAVFTDGLQMLTLNNETESVHQPFFEGLFPWLRKASSSENISILNSRLIDYLSGASINARTDDDKTLLLATRQ
ncbi:PP2C family serine/threonine-protein phosphatase [Pedobacter suwonensis]|uniref:PP2C family serine/threonine-protein phosphatase n=1 Tax=Pedobacter suwonensis TaxID=332999 RepID=UPI00119D8ECA|nr:PP2C family serine/threonine-protein phosphatase [Pedobacter suwonensis]